MMELLFPKAHALIDWNQECVFLEQELKQIFRDTQVGVRFVDKLIQVTLKPYETLRPGKRKKNKTRLIFIHLEIQVCYDHQLATRIFVYHYRLYDKLLRNVSSFVILADDKPNWKPNQYRYSSPLDSELSFTFPVAKLTDFCGHEEALLASNNAFALFIVAHLRTQATRGDDDARYQVKKNLIDILTAKAWEEPRINSLLRILDDLMYLPPELNEPLWYEITETQTESTAMNYIERLEYNAKESGRMEGMMEGELKGECKLLGKLLQKRFGPLPQSVTEKLNKASEQDLELWGEAILTASSLETVFNTTRH